MKFYTIIAIFILVYWSLPTQARPIQTEFSDMMEASATIVIATYLGPVDSNAQKPQAYYLKVTEVLKGNSTTGRIKVIRGLGGAELEVSPNTPCIAFITKNNRFEWVATNQHNQLYNSPLFVRGFYDLNAHIVYPSGISLKHLQDYIQTDSFSFVAAGHLHFYNTQTQQYDASDIHFKFQYTYPSNNQQVFVQNLDLGSFKSQTPPIVLPGHALKGRLLEIQYSKNLVRPFVIKGKIKSFNSQQEQFEVLFFVESPHEFNRIQLDTFLQNEHFGYLSYEIDVATQQGERYLFNYEYWDRSNCFIDNFNKKTWYAQTLGDPREFSSHDLVFKHNKRKALIIRLQPPIQTIAYYKYPYIADPLIRLLSVQPIEGQIFLRNAHGKEKYIDDCTLHLKNSRWVANHSYKK